MREWNIYTISCKQMATQKYLSYDHQMWVANHDNNEEGTFTNWYTGQVGRHHLHLLLQQSSTKYAKVHQLVHWAGWTAKSSWTIICKICRCRSLHFLWYPISTNFYQLMEYAPWPIGRPYDGGFRYNCMVLKVRTSSQYPKVKTLWNAVDAGGFRRWKSHKSWL